MESAGGLTARLPDRGGVLFVNGRFCIAPSSGRLNCCHPVAKGIVNDGFKSRLGPS